MIGSNTSKRVVSIVAIGTALMAFACGGGEPEPRTANNPPDGPTPTSKQVCSAKVPGNFGVIPLRNKTKQNLLLDGTDDLVISAMTDDPCFTLVERAQLSEIINELKLCADSNPDKEYIDCNGSFAKKGKILGVTHFVMGEVDWFEPNVKGAGVKLKIPTIGSIDAGRSYAALTFNVRVVEVETANVLASDVAHTVIPSDEAGISASGGGFDLSVAAKNKTPFGTAMHTALRDAVKRLRAKLRTKG